MNGRLKASVLAVLVGVGLALAGCTQSPVAPESTPTGDGNRSGAPPLVSIQADGTMDYVTVPESTLPDPTPRSTALVASTLVEGGRGGTLRVGRFSLAIPAGAFEGSAVVTMTMPDSTLMVCDLEITPLTQNHFKVPAELTADLSAPGKLDASDCTNYWYDPLSMRWVNLESKSRCSGTLITTNLEHFSTYGSGKAGW
jgi:hypothetical protein